VGYLNVLRLLGKDCLGLLGATAVIIGILVSLPRLARLPADFLRDKQVTVWVLAIVITIVVFLRLPHEAAYLIPLYPFGFLLMAQYFQRWVLAAVIGVVVFSGFVDLTSPGDDIDTDAFVHAHLGQGLLLSNRDTMKAQRRFADDIAKYPIDDNTVVMVGFIYPEFAVLNRDRLDVGIIEDDKDSISQLSDKGKAEDKVHRLVYVWLLDYDDFQTFQKQNYAFKYTLDAGRSMAALYKYRPSLFGATVADLGRGPSGSRGAARTDR
jgi:hypothetical protein